MNTFYLARHGETENNKAKRLSGWIDTPLTESGLTPTNTVIAKLKSIEIGVMYSSDLGRAVATAKHIAQGIHFDHEIIQHKGLREVSYGIAANMPSDEAYATYPELDRVTDFTPPNGESLATMQRRVLDTVHEIDELYNDQTILLVAHSGVMAAIESSYLARDFGQQNISEAYPHDTLASFTINNNSIASFIK